MLIGYPFSEMRLVFVLIIKSNLMCSVLSFMHFHWKIFDEISPLQHDHLLVLYDIFKRHPICAK